jgi:hypothetical protein
MLRALNRNVERRFVVECLLERKLERHGSRDALLIKERAKAFGP